MIQATREVIVSSSKTVKENNESKILLKDDKKLRDVRKRTVTKFGQKEWFLWIGVCGP